MKGQTINRLLIRTASLAAILLASALVIADDKEDKSTKVTATVTLPKELASFTDHTLELRLYEYDPLLADASADLVEKIPRAKFSHSKGKPTELKIEIGGNEQIKPRRNYYLTTFILDGPKRTHIGEKDGRKGLCKVLTDGHPRKVKIIIRAVQ